MSMTVAVVGGRESRRKKMEPIFSDISVRLESVPIPPSSRPLPRVIREADGLLFGGSWPVTEDVMRQLERCRVIGRFGLGYDSIDVEAATKRGIAVVVARGFCEEEMSDHVLAMMLAWHRRIVFYDRHMRMGSPMPDLPIPRISRLTIGLCGFGGVARCLVPKLHALGMDVIAYDPYVDARDMTRHGVAPVDFSSLLRRSDVVSVHCALTDKTRHLFSHDAFRRMKPHGIIINTARGGIVHTEALVHALDAGRIAGACLDVVEDGAVDAHDLDNHDRVLRTPHMAYRSEAAKEDLVRIAAINVRSVLEGNMPTGIVNPAVSETG